MANTQDFSYIIYDHSFKFIVLNTQDEIVLIWCPLISSQSPCYLSGNLISEFYVIEDIGTIGHLEICCVFLSTSDPEEKLKNFYFAYDSLENYMQKWV